MTIPLPPKTCTIDRLVTRPEDVTKMLAGEKTAQRRNGRYADIGETWELAGKTFCVDAVYAQPLGEITDDQAEAEGYASLDDYREAILAMHAGMPWIPQARVWVHEFRRLP
ncbi:MAG: ASCH domain-containing protein [Candidatus Sericytochromatia bacterium]|nr:ASCH domain-containing protein [Candidatus Sericytochromatia bacterium]